MCRPFRAEYFGDRVPRVADYVLTLGCHVLPFQGVYAPVPILRFIFQQRLHYRRNLRFRASFERFPARDRVLLRRLWSVPFQVRFLTPIRVLVRRFIRCSGQFANFLSHDGESASVRPRAGRFNRCVQGKQVRLPRDVGNGGNHVGDFRRA